MSSLLLEMERESRQMEEQIADPKLSEDPKKYQELLDRYAIRSDWFKDQGGYEIETRIRGVLHGMGFGSFRRTPPLPH